MSLTPFGLCSMVVNSTLNRFTTALLPKYTKRVLDHPPPPGYPVVGYSLFSGQLTSNVRLDQPRHQGKGVIPQQEVV